METPPTDDAALWGSAEELRTLCDLTADALAVSDPDGIVLWANQAYFQLYGYGPEAVIGHDVAVILPEDERPRARAHYRATFHQPTPPPPVESTVRRSDELSRVVESRVAYLTRDGQRIAMLSTIRDITERVQAEAALRAANDELERRVEERTRTLSAVNHALEGEMCARRAGEERYRTFFETTAIGAAECDPLDARFLRVNDALCHIMGYTRDDLLDRRVPDLTHPAARAAEDAARGRLVRGEVPSYRLQTRVVRADGQVIWAQVDTALARDAAGAPLHLVLLVEDITARRRAEDALRESEARFRTMADTAPVLLWMSDPDGSCTFFNKPWLDFTGRTLEQEVGDGWVESVHPDDRARCLAIHRAALRARGPFAMEHRLRRADGAYRWLLDHGVPRSLPDGTLAGYIGSLIDITDRKVAEEELRRSEARFRRLDCSGMIGLIVADEGGRVVEANDAFLALVGYTREDLASGRVDLAAMTPPEYAAVDAEAAQRLRIARA